MYYYSLRRTGKCVASWWLLCARNGNEATGLCVSFCRVQRTADRPVIGVLLNAHRVRVLCVVADRITNSEITHTRTDIESDDQDVIYARVPQNNEKRKSVFFSFSQSGYLRQLSARAVFFLPDHFAYDDVVIFFSHGHAVRKTASFDALNERNKKLTVYYYLCHNNNKKKIHYGISGNQMLRVRTL